MLCHFIGSINFQWIIRDQELTLQHPVLDIYEINRKHTPPATDILHKVPVALGVRWVAALRAIAFGISVLPNVNIHRTLGRF